MRKGLGIVLFSIEAGSGVIHSMKRFSQSFAPFALLEDAFEGAAYLSGLDLDKVGSSWP